MNEIDHHIPDRMKVGTLIESILRLRPKELILNYSLEVNSDIGFNEFLSILSLNMSITKIVYYSFFERNLSTHQKESFIETIGSMKNIRFVDFVNGIRINSRSLSIMLRYNRMQCNGDGTIQVLKIGVGCTLVNDQYRDVSDDLDECPGIVAIANAIQNLPSLETFSWAARQPFPLVIARALGRCPNLKNLTLMECVHGTSVLHVLSWIQSSKSLRSLVLRTWSPLTADTGSEASTGLYNIAQLLKQAELPLKKFTLVSMTGKSDGVCDEQLHHDFDTIVQALQYNTSLECLKVVCRNGITKQMGLSLANSIRLNSKHHGRLKNVSIHVPLREWLALYSEHHTIYTRPTTSGIADSSNQINHVPSILNASVCRAFNNAVLENHNLFVKFVCITNFSTLNDGVCITPSLRHFTVSHKLLRKGLDLYESDQLHSNIFIMSTLNSLGKGKLLEYIHDQSNKNNNVPFSQWVPNEWMKVFGRIDEYSKIEYIKELHATNDKLGYCNNNNDQTTNTSTCNVIEPDEETMESSMMALNCIYSLVKLNPTFFKS